MMHYAVSNNNGFIVAVFLEKIEAEGYARTTLNVVPVPVGTAPGQYVNHYTGEVAS